LPNQIESLEKTLSEIALELSDPNLYQDQPKKATELQAQISKVEADLKKSVERWEYLLNQSS